jgi:putative transposase
MLDVGVIQPSASLWAACPVLVGKPDGLSRWCVDWRGLNAVTVKDSYPMPRVDDCLEALEGAKWFCSMDLQHGYWQIPLCREDWQKMVFTTHMGLFEFTRTPMGVSNAPATFQQIMESGWAYTLLAHSVTQEVDMFLEQMTLLGLELETCTL